MTRMQLVHRIIGGIPPDLRRALRRQPLKALTDIGLHVQPVKQLTSARGAGGMCDGMSFSGRRTILFAPTESRRQNFTLLHEYAHLLLDANDDALNWLADQEQPGVEQEHMCDDIAAALLVPDEDLDAIVGTGPITGQHLINLFQNSEASQVVCAIALARRMGCAGAVLLTDRDTHKVVQAARVGRMSVYPTTNQVVPTGHPLRHIKPGDRVCRESFWATPWGDRRMYYINAAATTKRTYSILAESDLWGAEKFHAPLFEESVGERPSGSLTCSCGFSGTTTGWPCPDCNKQFCPQCKNCDCARRASLTERCAKCGLNAPRARMVGGLCSDCR
jgi:hypothetical protein